MKHYLERHWWISGFVWLNVICNVKTAQPWDSSASLLWLSKSHRFVMLRPRSWKLLVLATLGHLLDLFVHPVDNVCCNRGTWHLDWWWHFRQGADPKTSPLSPLLRPKMVGELKNLQIHLQPRICESQNSESVKLRIYCSAKEQNGAVIPRFGHHVAACANLEI